MVGLVTGVARMAVHFSYATPYCGGTEPDLRPPVLTQVHYLMFALILAAVVLIVTVAVSLVTKPRRPQQASTVELWLVWLCMATSFK